LKKIKFFFVILATFFRLGPKNIFYVALYKLRLKLNIHPLQRINKSISGEIFFNESKTSTTLPNNKLWLYKTKLFGHHEINILPKNLKWNHNYFNDLSLQNPDLPWWQISDFKNNLGDIKTIWELSRLNWLVAYSQSSSKDLQKIGIDINSDIFRWLRNNKPYFGPNWKCGQEASIRVLNLMISLKFLKQFNNPREEFINLIKVHLLRIYHTKEYAIAQKNNHAISEAVALFVGGLFTHRKDFSDLGRELIEKGVLNLFDSTGTFSQNSVNYHRMVLDLLCYAELWRRWFNVKKFSDDFYEVLKQATLWLRVITNDNTGDAPNIGANDGTNLITNDKFDYRDFRPTIQLSSILFLNAIAYKKPKYINNFIKWLGLKIPSNKIKNFQEKIGFFCAKGFITLFNKNFKLVFRYPYDTYRPGDCDAMHIDLWYKDKNVLRDGGSYSYNTDEEVSSYLSSAKGHNNIEFDNRDSMPKIRRFLRVGWLSVKTLNQPKFFNETSIETSASYEDWTNAKHKRRIKFYEDSIKVIDHVNGFHKTAVLRWRVPNDHWEINNNIFYNDEISFEISASSKFKVKLVNGYESRYYLKLDKVKVFEITVEKPCEIITIIKAIK